MERMRFVTYSSALCPMPPQVLTLHVRHRGHVNRACTSPVITWRTRDWSLSCRCSVGKPVGETICTSDMCRAPAVLVWPCLGGKGCRQDPLAISAHHGIHQPVARSHGHHRLMRIDVDWMDSERIATCASLGTHESVLMGRPPARSPSTRPQKTGTETVCHLPSSVESDSHLRRSYHTDGAGEVLTGVRGSVRSQYAHMRRKRIGTTLQDVHRAGRARSWEMGFHAYGAFSVICGHNSGLVVCRHGCGITV